MNTTYKKKLELDDLMFSINRRIEKDMARDKKRYGISNLRKKVYSREGHIYFETEYDTLFGSKKMMNGFKFGNINNDLVVAYARVMDAYKDNNIKEFNRVVENIEEMDEETERFIIYLQKRMKNVQERWECVISSRFCLLEYFMA